MPIVPFFMPQPPGIMRAQSHFITRTTPTLTGTVPPGAKHEHEANMEYEFLRDVTGQVKVRMSMDHEAVGHWFNEEVKDNLALLDDVEAAAREVKGTINQWQRVGHEYTLWLDEEEVMIRANQLALEDDGIEEGMTYYDEECLSFCGVEDFLAVIAAYRQFMAGKL